MHRPLLLGLSLAALCGCSESPAAPHGDASGTGELALLNALGAGDQPTLRIDGDVVALPPAGQAGTAALPAGAHRLEILDDASQSVMSSTFTLTGGGHRTAVLAGAAGHDVLLMTSLDTAAVPLTDAAKIRLVHAVADAPAVDAYLFTAGAAADSASRLVGNLRFAAGIDPAFTPYAIRPPAQYFMQLDEAGTNSVLVQAGPLPLGAGEVWSLILSRNDAGAYELRAIKEH